MSSFTGEESIKAIGDILNNSAASLSDRFRALFTLRNLGGKESIEAIATCFRDPSALLKHELAYCLGQMQDKQAIPVLVKVLEDVSQEPMVRHEAGEALGAIGGSEALEVLRKYCSDPVVEVAETCQLAVGKLELESKADEDLSSLPPNPYKSVDPTPPAPLTDVLALRSRLLDESLSLFERYRAMFTLRNLGTTEAVLALAEGLKCSSALFRHEVAYVLGQVQSPACVQQLAANLRDPDENPMVRHECAEALGSIATDECTEILKPFLQDPERVVKESCIVALDITEYEHSGQLQYADALSKVSAPVS